VTDQTKTPRRPVKTSLLASAVAAVVLTLGVFPGSVGAQEVDPTATAVGVCVDSEGFIDIEIVDDFSTTYNVFIDGELVAEETTDTDGVPVRYGPFEDGVYNVTVEWIGGETDILDEDVTLDCVPDETTTTTAAPTTTTTAAAAAAAAAPRFTG
jgi:hypothetical protein